MRKIIFIFLFMYSALFITLHGMQKAPEQKSTFPSVVTTVLLTGCVLYNLAHKTDPNKIAQALDPNKVKTTLLRNAKDSVTNFFGKK